MLLLHHSDDLYYIILCNLPLLRCVVRDCHVTNFAFFRTTFMSAVYKTYTCGASKNAKYCYLEIAKKMSKTESTQPNKNRIKTLSSMTVTKVKKCLQTRSVAENLVKIKMLSVEPIMNIQMKEARKIPLLLIVLSMSVKSLSYNVVKSDSPPFGLYDIFNYLIYYLNKYDNKYDKQALAAYKSFDDYRLFNKGYVELLFKSDFGRKHAFVRRKSAACDEG